MPSPLRFRRILTPSNNGLAFLYRAGDPLSRMGLVHSRADATPRATYNAQTGIVTLVPAATAFRDTHYAYAPTMGQSYKSVELEGSRQNLALQSNDVSNAAYTKLRCSAVKNATGPDGVASSASTVTEDATAGNSHSFLQTIAKAASALPYTFAVDLKPNGRTFCFIYIQDASGSSSIASVNLTTGAIAVAAAGSGVAFTSVSVGSSGAPNAAGWVRVWITGTTNAAVTLDTLVFLATSATWSAGAVYSGDSTSGVLSANYQIEQAAFPSSRIPTTTAAVTRAADALSAPWNYAPQAMTGYFRWVHGRSGGTGEVLSQIGTGVTSTVYVNTSGTGALQLVSFDAAGNLNIIFTGPAIPAFGDLCELRFFFQADCTLACGVAFNGGAETLMTNAGGTNIARTPLTAYSNTQLTIGDKAVGGLSFFAAFTHVLAKLGPETSLASARALCGV